MALKFLNTVRLISTKDTPLFDTNIRLLANFLLLTGYGAMLATLSSKRHQYPSSNLRHRHVHGRGH